MLTKCATASTLMCIGDFLCQQIEKCKSTHHCLIETLLLTSVLFLFFHSLDRKGKNRLVKTEELHELWLCGLGPHALLHIQQDLALHRTWYEQYRHHQEDALHSDSLHSSLNERLLHCHSYYARKGPSRGPKGDSTQTVAHNEDQLEGLAHPAVHQLHIRAYVAAGRLCCILQPLFQHLLELHEVRV